MNFFEHILSKCVWNYAIGKKKNKQKKTNKQKTNKKTNKIAESESKNKSQYGTENFPIVIVRLHTNK